jgi:hypothetical protein
MPLDRSLWEFLRTTLEAALGWLEANRPEQEKQESDNRDTDEPATAGPSQAPAGYSWQDDQLGAVSEDSQTVSGLTTPPGYSSDKEEILCAEADKGQQAHRRHLINIGAPYREYRKYYERFGRSCCWTCNSPTQSLNHRCQTSHGVERQHCLVHRPRTCPLQKNPPPPYV